MLWLKPQSQFRTKTIDKYQKIIQLKKVSQMLSNHICFQSFIHKHLQLPSIVQFPIHEYEGSNETEKEDALLERFQLDRTSILQEGCRLRLRWPDAKSNSVLLNISHITCTSSYSHVCTSS